MSEKIRESLPVRITFLHRVFLLYKNTVSLRALIQSP